LVKAFQILDLFSESRPPWTQAELARQTGLNRSTLSRLIRFLTGRGYLVEHRGRYTLGFAAVDLGRRAQLQFDLVDLCADMLDEVAQSSFETAILTTYDEPGGRVVCLAQIPSRQGGLQVYESVGTGYPLHSGASAKAVLAFLPERKQEAVLAGDLRHVNAGLAQSAERLRSEIEAIRQRGYAITRDETYPGVAGVAVPILTPNAHPVGSIAIAAPAQRVSPEILEAFGARLVEVGRKASARVGSSGEAGAWPS
jgi:DNA-binding IclR family transcriptional regulator